MKDGEFLFMGFVLAPIILPITALQFYMEGNIEMAFTCLAVLVLGYLTALLNCPKETIDITKGISKAIFSFFWKLFFAKA
jgi:hypothetical protein